MKKITIHKYGEEQKKTIYQGEKDFSVLELQCTEELKLLLRKNLTRDEDIDVDIISVHFKDIDNISHEYLIGFFKKRKELFLNDQIIFSEENSVKIKKLYNEVKCQQKLEKISYLATLKLFIKRKRIKFKKNIKKFKADTKRFINWNIVYKIFSLRKINNKKIYFESFLGRSYSDSPKYIYEYIVKNDSKYINVWGQSGTYDVYVPTINEIQGYVVKKGTFKYFYEIATAKYIVSNSRMPINWKKRKNQVYIQTWHGTPLKRLVYDMENVTLPGTDMETYYENFKKDINTWDYLVIPNEFAKEKLTSAFKLNDTNMFKGQLLESGYPRNDILKNPKNIDQEALKRVKSVLEIQDDEKVILYTPTFRDDDYIRRGKYIQPIMFDIEDLTQKIGKCKILIKAHYLVTKKFDFFGILNNDNVIDVSSYDDINELYLISDLLITDYSSTFFDYSLLKKPIVFFQYDYLKYKNEIRGFYLNTEYLPTQPVYNFKDLNNKIKEILDNKKYTDGYNSLNLNEYHTNSSEYIYEKIFLNNNKKSKNK